MVLLSTYMNPSRSLEDALRAAASDLTDSPGATLELPNTPVVVNGSAFTIPANVSLAIPIGGQISVSAGAGPVTVLGRVNSESTTPLAGAVQSGA